MKEQILVNLKYDYTKKRLICLISDTGIGIKQEEQAKIFNPLKTNFQNNQNTIDQIGIGLLISKQLVQCYGGSLDVVSKSREPHRGTTIVFTFEIEKLERLLTETELKQESYRSSQLLGLSAINLEVNSSKALEKAKLVRSFALEGDNSQNFGDLERQNALSHRNAQTLVS